MRKLAFLKIKLDSEEEARALHAILKPEVKSDADSSASLESKRNHLTLRVSSNDRAVFRAILASYNRFIRIYEDIKSLR